MWAGGRLTYHAPLTIGGEGVRESTILKVEAKSGRAGKLVFVTVSHSVTCNGTACITEEQDIVYREAAAPGSPAPPASPAPQDAAWSEEFRPDTVLLFRYSALTSNGHRIHYDQAYARAEENYPDLVVHGWIAPERPLAPRRTNCPHHRSCRRHRPRRGRRVL